MSVNPLEYLIDELELELQPARPVHPRRSGRIVAASLVLALLVGVTWVASGRVDRKTTETAEGAVVEPAGGTDSSGDGDATVEASSSGVDAYRGADWIAAENARPGTLDWIIPDEAAMWDRIRGYASATSVDHGETVTLYVTTAAPTYTVDAYRMGYYDGNAARLVWSSGEQPGRVQADATVDPKTNMAEARWEPSLVVQTGPEWPPGMYLFRLTSSDGGATFVPLVLRDDGSRAPILVQSSVTTWQAYNVWGGANLYSGRGGGAGRARVVSFDRPYGGNGSGEFFGREFEFVYFVERLGLDVTYWTDIDLHLQGDRASNHRAVVSLGHDEYYSTAMREGLERARDDGVNLAFLGANAIYRKIRLEDSPIGPARREVNYRVASEDPLSGTQPDEVTVSWREAPSSDPESSLIGNYYECNPVEADMVIVDADAWMFDGADLRNGDILPGAVGNEYDRVTPEAPTPDNIQVLAHSPVVCRGKASFADMTYYTAPSGAGVFAVGTFWWIPPLKSDCPDGPATGPDCRIQKVVENVLRDFALGPAGDRHPSVNNLERFGIEPGYTARIEAPQQDPTPTTTPPRVTSTTRPGSTTTRPPSTTAPATSSTTAATTTTTTAAPADGGG